MQVTITCPHCHRSFPLEDALKNQIGEEVLGSERKKHLEELQEIRLKTQREAIEKTKAENELEIKNLKDSAAEEKERSNKFLNELTELNKKLRTLERKDQERDLEMQKILSEKEEKIRYEARAKADEENSLINKEKDKKLTDQQKLIDEMKRKMQQGSQQTQGEILELELENILKDNFQFDLISEIKKGQKGADIKQLVRSKNGNECGLILWESKNYQEKWSNTWIPKLKQDQRQTGAIVAILVTHTLPKEIKTDFGFLDGVWVCKTNLVIPVACALRDGIYEVARQKAVGQNRINKADLLYDYITGSEFNQRITAINEVYLEMKDQIDAERRAFEIQWTRREKQLEKFRIGIGSIGGSIQGIAGQSSVPAFKEMDFLELVSGSKRSKAG